MTTDRAPTILVVDDEPAVRGLFVQWLNQAGYCCVEAGCAADAWIWLEGGAIQLVTLDITLSGLFGTELLPGIKRTCPDTEVLIITAHELAQSAITALAMGAAGYLIKPVVAEELLFQVKTALERRQLLIDKRLYMQRLEDRVAEQTREICRAHEETIHRLVTAASHRDEETGAHIRRTGLLSEVLALAAGWSPTEASQLRMAAPMHDVGKIGIPDAILQKSGPLTCEELEKMKQHTTIGAQILTQSETPVLRLAETVALSHHERWDGTGYPQGLAGEAIPEAARIVSIVDVYDALTHDRVYRSAFSEEDALSMMRAGQGVQFDPGLLALFFVNFEQLQAISDSHPEVPHHVETGGHIPLIVKEASPLQGGRELSMASGIDDYWSPTRPLTPNVVLERWSAARNGDDAQRQNQLSETINKSHAPVQERVTTTRFQPQRPLPRDVFDIEAMHALVENDLDLLAEMIDLYLSSSPLLLTELESAVAAGDGERVARAAHTFKGVLGNMCASACEEAASQLEMMGTKDATGGARQLLDTLQRESQRLKRVLTDVAQGVEV